MLRKKDTPSQPCYTPAVRGNATFLGQFDAHPGGHAKWVESPHGPATVSSERYVSDATEVCLGKAT